jgi:CDP-diacylglycerol--serine O-phosphatidyltransferase
MGMSFSLSNTLAKALHPTRRRVGPSLEELPFLPMPAACLETLHGPGAFRERLLDLIARARTRILMPALYLQDDDAGWEVLTALYAAKAATPELRVDVFVDWHRARRGLIGKTRSLGNAALYRDLAARLGPGVTVHGVPVQTREWMGVMHLKGFVLDDQVLYSGASLNDVYLHRHERYRLDRYHLISSRPLADSMAGLLTQVFLPDPAVQEFDREVPPAKLRGAILKFRRQLKRAQYRFEPGSLEAGAIGITPLLGLGRSGNVLNGMLLQMIQQAQERLVLFTPYFNLPGPLRRAVRDRLRAGCQVLVVLGDKTANDFYIPPGEPFKTIGALPYLYEANLRRFCRSQQKALDQGQLQVHLWRDGDNTFHLKGILADGTLAMLTGNNLNPRAWSLDLENGLLIRDPQRLLERQHGEELEGILGHTRRLGHYRELETMKDYPAPVQRLLKQLSRARIDRLINQVL